MNAATRQIARRIIRPADRARALVTPARGEERLLRRLTGRGSRRGSSLPGRVGDLMRQPVVWVAFAVALEVSGPRGRRAALRGVACRGTSSLIHLLLKPLSDVLAGGVLAFVVAGASWKLWPPARRQEPPSSQ